MKIKICIIISLIVLILSCSKKMPETTYYDKAKTNIKTTTITLGFTTYMEDPRGIASQLFKKNVEKRTGKRICVDIYARGTLGNDEELINKILKKQIDMTISSAGNFAIHEKMVGISALPFLFNNFEEAWAFMDSEVGLKANDSLQNCGLKVLANFDNGFRCITTREKEIKTVSDMKNLHIRTPPNYIIVETMKALGAIPEVYPFPQLKKALKDGLFDSQENPIPIILNNELYEVQKNLIITNHSYDAMPLVIRMDLWNKLTTTDKTILLESAKKAQEFNRILIKEQTESYKELLKSSGMKITYPKLDDFKKTTEVVIEKYYPELKEEILSTIKN